MEVIAIFEQLYFQPVKQTAYCHVSLACHRAHACKLQRGPINQRKQENRERIRTGAKTINYTKPKNFPKVTAPTKLTFMLGFQLGQISAVKNNTTVSEKDNFKNVRAKTQNILRK
jgi:hypothetical protein